MASLVDLFNPSFLMFLGVLVLIVAGVVVYFESKLREQNHKITSMFSLVATLVDDMNGVKMGLNRLAIRGGSTEQQHNLGTNKISVKNHLIEVSDDEDEDEDDDDESSVDKIEIMSVGDTDNDDEDQDDEDQEDQDEDLDEVLDEDQDDDDDDDDYDTDNRDNENQNIKVLKLNILNDKNISDNEEENFDLNNTVEDLECDLEPAILGESYVEGVLNLQYDENNMNQNLNETTSSSFSELKTISINLGEEHNSEGIIDYKKLQLQKLRSIVVEKGLTSNSEASKLKKPELLKLLGAE